MIKLEYAADAAIAKATGGAAQSAIDPASYEAGLRAMAIRIAGGWHYERDTPTALTSAPPSLVVT